MAFAIQVHGLDGEERIELVDIAIVAESERLAVHGAALVERSERRELQRARRKRVNGGKQTYKRPTMTTSHTPDLLFFKIKNMYPFTAMVCG